MFIETLLGLMLNKGDSVSVQIETNEESKKVDPYNCAIKALVGQPPQLKTVGHIPREISRHVFFFLKEENGRIEGTFHFKEEEKATNHI